MKNVLIAVTTLLIILMGSIRPDDLPVNDYIIGSIVGSLVTLGCMAINKKS